MKYACGHQVDAILQSLSWEEFTKSKQGEKQEEVDR